jgi:hypothetical protein
VIGNGKVSLVVRLNGNFPNARNVEGSYLAKKVCFHFGAV